MAVKEKEKDTDTRPMLDRISNGLAGAADLSVDATPDALTVTYGDTKLVIRNATAMKGIIAAVTGMDALTEKKVGAIAGAEWRRTGLEVSWRGLEALCVVLKYAAAPKGRKAAVAATEKASAAAAAQKAADLDRYTSATTKLAIALQAARYEIPATANVAIRDVDHDTLSVAFTYAPEAIAAVKTVYGARWNAGTKSWAVPVRSIDGLVRALPSIVDGLMTQHAADDVRRDEAAAVRDMAYAKATGPKETAPRIMVMVSDGVREGDIIERPGRTIRITGLGRVFRIDGDMPSEMGWTTGREGEAVRYAYYEVVA